MVLPAHTDGEMQSMLNFLKNSKDQRAQKVLDGYSKSLIIAWL